MLKVNKQQKHQNDVSDVDLVFLKLTLTPYSVSIVDLEQVNVSWVMSLTKNIFSNLSQNFHLQN